MSDTHYEWKRGAGLRLGHCFTSTEFECPCGCDDQRISRDLVERLTRVRQDLGAPVFVTSGYRCHAYQEDLRRRGYETAVGVSQHELGNAADLRAKDMALLRSVLPAHFKAIGVGPTFSHVDTRRDKNRSWAYIKRS